MTTRAGWLSIRSFQASRTADAHHRSRTRCRGTDATRPGVQDVLAEHGYAEVRHHRNVAEAAPHFDELASFRLAIVEARLGAAEVVSFTERLARAGVATIVMSADRGSAEFFPHAVALGKPFDAAGLIAACDAAKARFT